MRVESMEPRSLSQINGKDSERSKGKRIEEERRNEGFRASGPFCAKNLKCEIVESHYKNDMALALKIGIVCVLRTRGWANFDTRTRTRKTSKRKNQNKS